jgi:type IV pilus assembly protein PilY1
MNIFHCNPKTVSNTEGSSLSSSSGFMRRTVPALLVLAVWFVLAAGGGIGVNAVYADTLEVWVSADDDDAEESASGSIDLTSSDLELIRSGDQTHVGMRFTNINIPQGAFINNAYIEFAVDETGYDEATTLVFHGQAHNNATAFTSTSLNISTRATTTASVTWNIAYGDQWTPEHTKYQSPNLAGIIQEIVDRSGWESNNALVIIVAGSGKRTVESYDGADGHGDVTLAAKLFVDYTGGSDNGATCRIFYRDNLQTQASSTTSLSAGAPSVSEGDLMIATVAFGDGDAVISAPAGWTLIQPSSPGGEAMRTSAWYKVSGASESGPYVFSASGAGDEMLVDIATFYSSAGAAVLAWDLEDSSYKYSGVADTVINSNKVDCVDTSLIYFAGADDIAANVASRPSGMTVLAEQQQSLLSLATYYQFRDSGKDLIKTMEWANPADFLSAIAAVFSCQSVVEYDIDATASINGSISPSGVISVPDTGSKTFSIIPDSGYEVLDVIVDGKSEGAVTSYTFNNVRENHTISASFTASGFYIISTSPGSNGSISPAGPVAVAPGADQTFTIIPDDGYVVDEVTVDGKMKGVETSWTFSNVNEGHSIAATFVVDTADPPDDTCVEIEDVPLDARFESAPPNILIALDDSGSMSFEILVPGAYDGRYLDFNDYLFDNPCGDTFGGTPGCHEYDRGTILGRGDRRLHWKTQWAGFNKVYYDPTIDYEPWPLATGRMDNADANNPRSHPMYASPTFDLGSSFDILSISVGGEVIVDDADAGSFSRTGPWEYFTDPQGYPNDGPNKDGYYSAIQEGQDYTATWAPYLLEGQYEVWIWYVAADWRKDKVKYTITHADGADTKEVDQRSDGGQWVKLGDYNFNTGKADVTLTHNVCHSDHGRAAADAVKFVPKDGGGYKIDIDIPRAHYYVESQIENKPYLVVVDGGSIEYYEFHDANGDDIVGADELHIVVTPPADVQTGRTYVEERQNFANWYSYYRRRGFTATYATAELITNMQAVRIGLYGINIGKSWTVTQPVLNIKNDDQDYTETLLNLLYDFKWQGGTPLRRALEAAGRYFDKHDNKKLDGSTGDDSPWDTSENGGECQQAFTIVITDGYYNGNAPQAGAINNNDGDDGEPYADTYSDTLADVAMYYYERDLNTDLANNVPENASDDASHQHLVTYSIGFGVIGSIDPNDYDDDLKHKTTEDYIVWPDATVGRSTPQKVDDVWHAAVNGRGDFLNSSNPKELVNALNSVMKDIERRVFSASGVAINGDELYQRLEPDLLMFQASYSSEGWTGNIKAFKVDEFSGGVDTLNPEWAAADLLDSKSWTGRIIATHNGTTGIPFRFDSLTDAQKDQIDPDWGTDDTHARNMMDYLHGDISEEERNGGPFRNRFSVLGDIVHSAPVFKNDILYAGANDGMLHAFAAATGEELFAYVPNLLFANLHQLTEPLYDHKYFVDLAPTIKDVDLSSGVKTMLIGGLGKGGRGYFALDLTDIDAANVPATESELDNRVMWEYPDGATLAAEVEDLGYSFTRPAVVRSNDSTGAPWIVIFGNGYNSTSGHAVLFILDPVTGELLKRFDTLVGTCNGMSTPIAVDVDNNNTVDYVYAGDIKGNLWKFDLSADDYNLWDVAYKSAGVPMPLFSTPNQPITSKPSVMYHCEKHGYLVTFGTGRYLGLADISNTDQQSIYGIWDYGDYGDDSEYVGAFDGSAITNADLPAGVSFSLLEQVIVDERTIDGVDFRTFSNGVPDWTTATKSGADCGDFDGAEDCDFNDVPSEEPYPDPVKDVGWYFDLPESGERVVSDVRIRAGKLTVLSFVNEGSTCGLAGHSWVMVMDPCTGGRLAEAHFDVDGDGDIDKDDLINIGTVGQPKWVPGKVELPSYLIKGDVETGYYNTSDTEIETLLQKAPRLGMTHWRVLRD